MKPFTITEHWRSGEYIVGPSALGSRTTYLVYNVVDPGRSAAVKSAAGHEEILLVVEGTLAHLAEVGDHLGVEGVDLLVRACDLGQVGSAARDRRRQCPLEHVAHVKPHPHQLVACTFECQDRRHWSSNWRLANRCSCLQSSRNTSSRPVRAGILWS